MVSPLMTDSAGPPAPSPLGDQPPPGLLGITSRVTEADTAAALTEGDIKAAVQAMQDWQPPPHDEIAMLTEALLADETAAAELDPPVT